MRSLSAMAAGLATLVVAGCADESALPPPPPRTVLSEMRNVTAMSAHQVPTAPNCTDYTATGTLAGTVQTINGRSCRLADGTYQVIERTPDGLVHNSTYNPALYESYAYGGDLDEFAPYAADGPYEAFAYDGFFDPFLFGFGFGVPVFVDDHHGYGRFHGGFHHVGWHGGGWRGGGFHGGGFHGGDHH